MEFSIKAGSPEKLKSACIVVGVYADKKLAPSATLADAAAQGALGAIVRRGDMTGKRGTALMLHGVTGVLSERVLLVGLGKAAELNDKTYAEVLRAAFKAIATSAATDAIVTLAEIPVGERSLADKIRAAVTIARETAYRYDQTKSRKEDPATLRKLTFTVDKADQRAAGRGLAEGVALANGTDLAKTLGNLPANICTPTYLAQTARTIGREWGSLDFVVHAIAFSDKDELTGRYVDTTADNFTKTMFISVYSFTAVAQRAEKLMTNGGSLLTLTYYGAEKWMPHYNVMGVAKAGLEASVRYLAADLGPKAIRVNAISAGPIKTLAASGIGDFRYILRWNEYNSPLRRTVTIDEVGDSGFYLLSDLGRGVTGEILHVDAGYHIVGMKNPDAPDITVNNHGE